MGPASNNAKRGTGRVGRAFSLLELLVVIAIISLLVTIMVPGLNRAKELAKRSICAVNLHHVYISMQFYLHDHTHLPKLTRTRDVRLPILSNADLAPWYLSPAIYHINNPTSPGQSEYVNFGTMFESGYVDDIRQFYCPSQTHPEFQYATSVNPWPIEDPRRLEGAEFKYWNDTFASYCRRLGLSYMEFDDVPAGTAIVADVNMLPAYTRTHHLGEGFNVLYTDSGVAFNTDRWFHKDEPAYENYTFRQVVEHCVEGFERLDRRGGFAPTTR